MKLITRKLAESLDTLAGRAYDTSKLPDTKTASSALAADNPTIAADLEKTATGTVLRVPELADAPPRDALGPTRLAHDQSLALLRALADVHAERSGQLAAEVADATFIRDFFRSGPVPAAATNFQDPTYQAGIVRGLNDLIARRDDLDEALAKQIAGLAGELAVLRRRLGDEPGPPLELRRFTIVSEAASTHEVRLTVPEGFKILGGGAVAPFTAFVQQPLLLIESRPESPTTWVVRASDHPGVPLGGRAEVTVTVIALSDPNDEFELDIAEATSIQELHPATSVAVRRGFTLTGGGARAVTAGPGVFLTASHPADHETWSVAAKDHLVASPGTVTAYAIGLRSRRGRPLRSFIRSATSIPNQHPAVEVRLPTGFVAVGGGARDEFQEPGNMLVSSAPSRDEGWRAAASEFRDRALGTLTAYAIGLADTVLQPSDGPPLPDLVRPPPRDAPAPVRDFSPGNTPPVRNPAPVI